MMFFNKKDKNKDVLICECGNMPTVREISGMGEFFYSIRCLKCKKGLVYSLYDEGYEKSAKREWNKYTRYNSNPLQSYCSNLVRVGIINDSEVIIDLLCKKFNISKKEANVYYLKYIDCKFFQIYCEFFKYRYHGLKEIDYKPLVQDYFKLSDEALEIYHSYWLDNMEKNNGRYLKEGVDYRRKIR